MIFQPFSVFVSYARENQSQLLRLKDVLKPLERKHQVSLWSDQELLGGDTWDREIHAKLKTSDVIVFLVSTEFLRSEYINDVEVQHAVERSRRGEALVFPVLIGKCLWEKDPTISQLQITPKDGRPLSTWDDPDDFFLEIGKELDDAIMGLERKRRRQTPQEPITEPLQSLPESPVLDEWRAIDRSTLSGLTTSTNFSWVTAEQETTPFDRALEHPGERSGIDQHVIVDTVHAGDYVPTDFLEYFQEYELKRRYAEEKDWGANDVALTLAKKLGLQGYYRLDIARVLLDYGRFPGITHPDGAEHMHRLAITPPLAEKLNYREKSELLNIYDQIALDFRELCHRRRIKIAVHTYDRYNDAPNEELRTRRPEISLLYRSLAYETKKRMPFGLFDPLFIAELGEHTADTRLMARISLALESTGKSVGHNHPYNLPEGSVEVRASVWSFFDYLRTRYEAEVDVWDDALEDVWTMLLDTNLRDREGEVFRSYIHMFRNPPQGAFKQRCEAAQGAYDRVHDYVREHREDLIKAYRSHPRRIDTFAIEFRKDKVWNEADGTPITPYIDEVSDCVSQAIKDYLRIDLGIDDASL